MNRTNNTITPAFRRFSAGTAAFALTAGGSVAALTMLPAMTAHAQANSAELPTAARPVMERAAMVYQAAQARVTRAPESAQQSYRMAADAMKQALSAGRFASTGTAPFNDARSAYGLPISSTQVADDIRVLRAASKNATGSQAAMLQKIAGLYATGVKEFFTAQLREALLGDLSPKTVIAVRATGTATSAARRNSNAQGGVLQPDGSVVPGNQIPSSLPNPYSSVAPNNPLTTGALAPPIVGSGVVGSGVIVSAPTIPVVPTGTVVTTPVAPVAVPTAPTTPVTNPTTP